MSLVAACQREIAECSSTACSPVHLLTHNSQCRYRVEGLSDCAAAVFCSAAMQGHVPECMTGRAHNNAKKAFGQACSVMWSLVPFSLLRHALPCELYVVVNLSVICAARRIHVAARSCTRRTDDVDAHVVLAAFGRRCVRGLRCYTLGCGVHRVVCFCHRGKLQTVASADILMLSY